MATSSAITSAEALALLPQNPNSFTGEDGIHPYARNISYHDQWKKHLQQSLQSNNNQHHMGDDVIVHDCCCCCCEITKNDSNDVWVLACTNHGSVYAWKIPLEPLKIFSKDEEWRPLPRSEASSSSVLEDDDDEAGRTSPANARKTGTLEASSSSSSSSLLKPMHQWQLNPHHTALYKLHVVTTSIMSSTKRMFLYVAGEDCGILAYDLDQLLLNSATNNARTFTPVMRFEPFPNPFSTVAFVDFVIDVAKNTITALALDDWGLYRWNLDSGERIPIRLSSRKANHGALTCFCPLQDHNDNNDSFLCASESGIIYCVRNKNAMDMDDDNYDDDKNKLTEATLDMRALLKLPNARVTHMVEINHFWWTIAGSATTNSTSGGFIATIHAPSQSVVHSIITRETPQRLLCSKNQRLTVLSNTPIVQHLHAVSLEVKERWWSSLKSCHAMATTNDASGDDEVMTVVCGVGGQLDVYRASTRIVALAL